MHTACSLVIHEEDPPAAVVALLLQQAALRVTFARSETRGAQVHSFAHLAWPFAMKRSTLDAYTNDATREHCERA